MAHAYFNTITLEDLLSHCNKTLKDMAIAKDKLEKDRRIVGIEYEKKKVLIMHLEEICSCLRSAKTYYDAKKLKLAESELSLVKYRLMSIKRLNRNLLQRNDSEADKLIQQEYFHLNELYTQIIAN